MTEVGRRVVCAATRNKKGIIAVGARHYDRLMRAQMTRAGGRKRWWGAEQGFVDQRGIFMTREEARQVAEAAGQILRRCGGDRKELFSENLS